MREFVIGVGLAAFLLAGQANAELLVEIDKDRQQMVVSVDGRQRYTWPVSTGTPDRATPAGSFQPFRMEEHHFSKEWDDAPMPHSIFFTKSGHAIHGSEAISRLGSPASHGCVRLAPSNAETLFGLVEAEGLLHTRVVIAGTEPTRVARAEPPSAPQAHSAPKPEPEIDPRRRKRRWSEDDWPDDERESVFADSFGNRFDESPEMRSDDAFPDDRGWEAEPDW
jgi:L,D-transpeptidase catalytic domain